MSEETTLDQAMRGLAAAAQLYKTRAQNPAIRRERQDAAAMMAADIAAAAGLLTQAQRPAAAADLCAAVLRGIALRAQCAADDPDLSPGERAALSITKERAQNCAHELQALIQKEDQRQEGNHAFKTDHH